MMLMTMLLSMLKTTQRSNEVLLLSKVALMFALLCVLGQFGNCFVSGESVANTGNAGVQAAVTTIKTTTTTTNGAIKHQQQKQQQQQTTNATAASVTSTTATQKFIQQRKENGESVGVVGNVGVGVDNAARNSGEQPLSEDGVERPTTYRPGSSRATNATQTAAAQDRERKLKNVLAARRTALHRGGFRTRIGTTGRTATIETTSKAPTDPRSVCIRNCTKNFTRRTTASCMRQCANFSRMTGSAAANMANATVIVRPSSKSGGETAVTERDTNEILFSDESSHGLFVVAKEQNDTINHITDAAKGAVPATGGSGGDKLRRRGRPALLRGSVTAATTSIEDIVDDDVNDDNDGDDALQPYLFFGPKLPPIKPATLTITSVSDEHPRLLEVSVAHTASTTPSTTTTATTKRALTEVERSRSRYKYNMRYSSSTAAAAVAPAAAAVPAPVQRQRYVGSGRPTTGLVVSPVAVLSNTSSTAAPLTGRTRVPSAEPAALAMKVAHLEARSNEVPPSTPLIINVPSEEDEATQSPTPVSKRQSTVMTTRAPPTTTTTKSTTTTSTTTTAKPTTTTTTAEPTTTTSTTTTTAQPTTTTTATPRTTTTRASSTTPKTTTTTTSTTTTTPTPITTTTPKIKSIIEEDTDRLRSMGPALTQQINIDDQNNLVVFCKNPEDCGVSPGTPISGSTDSSYSKILRTLVQSSVRSTVHPPTTSVKPPASSYIGVVESAESQQIHHHSTPPTATQPEISSTVVTDEGEVSDEIRRVNIVNMVLSAVGLVPLVAIVLYLVRNYVLRRRVKDDEDFDVCITDQQPISPVTKLDAKHARDDDEDEVDHQMTQHSHPHHHHQQQQQAKMPTRDANHNHRYDDKSSLASEYQEFNRSKIRLKSLLGEGNFGQVWKAEADDLSGHFGATRIVAVKTIRACSAQASLKDEANIMRKLGSHPNVVTLLGACVESEPHMLIMEYAMRGRLLSLLRAARSATNILPASVPGGRSLAPLSPRTLAGFALDIACGMEYIAERRIVHRDLAARNILLDHNGMCKICDFGMSLDLDAERKRKELEKNAANDVHTHRFKFDFGGRYILQHWQNSFGHHNGHCAGKEHSEKKSHGHGHDTMGKRHALPIRWMAAEALQYHLFTTETDIWAFGIVLWEIATLGSTPYQHLTGREVIRRVPAGLRPELPKESRHEFYNLMSRCWHKDPHMRPSFSQSRLEITRSLHKWVDDDSAASDYMDVSGFSEDLEHGVVYFNHRISEFECEI